MNVKVINLQNNKTIVDMITSNYSNREYPACYYDGKATAVLVPDAQVAHDWHFEFSSSVFFDFFLLNLKIPRLGLQDRGASNEIDSMRVKNIRIEGEEDRTCALDFSTRDKWTKIFWFWCTESVDKVLNRNLEIKFTTYSSHTIKSIGLHQIYFTKLQYCGHPTVPLMAKYLPQNEETQQIVCDPEVSYDMNSATNSSDLILSEDQMMGDCVDDEYWAGSPKCVPKLYCKVEFNEVSEEIMSVKNAYIFDTNKWYAIEGTSVSYRCKPDYEFVTDSFRTCLHNSTWDQTAPVCRENRNAEIGEKYPA